MGAIEKLITENLPIWSSSVQSKSTAGRGKSSKRKLYGVKKLRELILDLAVRGLLVPQDPNDEPASVLLEKIANEKERLINNGKIKKPKKIESHIEGPTPSIPNGWKECSLNEILERISNGFSGKQNKDGHGYPLSRIETISDSIFDMKKTGFSDQIPESKLDYYKLRKDDILISHINSDYHVGKTALFTSEGVLYHGTNLIMLRLLQGISALYIDLYLNKIRLSGYFLSIAQHAIGQSSINQSKIIEIKVPIPPLAEQHRIVAKVDELMALCDTLEQQQEDSIQAHETLVETLLGALTNAPDAESFQSAWQRVSVHFDTLLTTEHSVDKLKETILQLGVMGKLVSQDPSDEPASVLLEKIAADKEQLIKDGKIKKQQKIAEHEGFEKYQIPSLWKWARLGDLSSNIHYGYTASSRVDDKGIRLLRITDIQDGKVNWKTVPSCEITDEKSQGYLLENDDILIARTGGTIGKSYLVENINLKAVFASYLIRVKRIQSMYSPYIKTFLGSETYWAQLYGSAAGTGQPNVNATALKGLFVPIPPLNEQHRIVAKVDELMALCDDLKRQLNEAQITQMQLTDAVTEQAVN
jgi:type I restriction enzyme, S subunit